MPNAKNTQIVQELKEKINKAKSIVFADYLGLSVNDLNSLRADIKTEGAEVTVAKNTLVKVALKEAKIDEKSLETDLTGPTAVVFSYNDPISPIKKIFEYAKRLELPKVKSAIIEGIYNTAFQVEQISKLPSKEELLAKVIYTMKSPLYGITNVLSGSQRKFVYALSAIAREKSAKGGVENE